MPWIAPRGAGVDRQADAAYSRTMIRMTTFEELHSQSHSLGLYCAACDRWGDADLARLIEAGHGHRTVVDTRFRCRDCGDAVEKQIRPPAPRVGGAAAYI